MKPFISTILIFVSLLISVLFLSSCGEQMPPITELEQASRDYCAKFPSPIKVRGISLQPHPNNIYLVTVDGETTESKTTTVFLIGQIYRTGEKSYWQVTFSTPEKLKALNIKTPQNIEE